jgi:hypothetical protein
MTVAVVGPSTVVWALAIKNTYDLFFFGRG